MNTTAIKPFQLLRSTAADTQTTHDIRHLVEYKQRPHPLRPGLPKNCVRLSAHTLTNGSNSTTKQRQRYTKYSRSRSRSRPRSRSRSKSRSRSRPRPSYTVSSGTCTANIFEPSAGLAIGGYQEDASSRAYDRVSAAYIVACQQGHLVYVIQANTES